MPFYDFKCNRCETVFNVLAAVSEMKEKRIPCPGCGSRDLTRIWQTANISVQNRAAAEEPRGACRFCQKDCPNAGRA